MGINKVDFGDENLIDLTSDTVAPEYLQQGYTAHNAAGDLITGTSTYDMDSNTIQSDISQIKQNTNDILTDTQVIGTTSDTGATATTGSVMGKLNKIISGNGVQTSYSTKNTVTTGLVSDFSETFTASSTQYLSRYIKLAPSFAINKIGTVQIYFSFECSVDLGNYGDWNVVLVQENNSEINHTFVNSAVGTVIKKDGANTTDLSINPSTAVSVSNYTSYYQGTISSYDVYGDGLYSLWLRVYCTQTKGQSISVSGLTGGTLGIRYDNVMSL